LLERNGTNYLNEPYATGGNPVLAGKDVLFNDMLGTTQGITANGKYQQTNATAFGAGDKSAFFTGKPYVEGLGSVFLFRNYRPELSKWQTADPLGYPDGWNNLAYINNKVTNSIDWEGTWEVTISVARQASVPSITNVYINIVDDFDNNTTTIEYVKSYYFTVTTVWNAQSGLTCTCPDCPGGHSVSSGCSYATSNGVADIIGESDHILTVAEKNALIEVLSGIADANISAHHDALEAGTTHTLGFIECE